MKLIILRKDIIKMEYEVRYYFSKEKLNYIISKLKEFKELKVNHSDKDKSFYSKNIDGRFRVRVTKSDTNSKCKLSWKRRIKSTLSTDVNKEEEVELTIKYEEYENLMFIINNVLKMKSIESYERYRTIFTNDDVEISVDEYPFGIAVEIENKSIDKDPEEVVKKWAELLDLNIEDAYRLSWDDKYAELCKEQGIKHFNHVTFELPMPKVVD